MVGEELKGNHRQEWMEDFLGLRHVDDIIGDIRRILVAFDAEGDHRPLTSLDFLHVRENLVTQVIVGNDEQAGRLFVDQSDGTMFDLGGAVAFGMDVSHLFQLQGPFQGHWVVQTAAEEKKTLGLMILLGQYSTCDRLCQGPR